ncbi:hypothetical protein BGW41_002398 [Actinomortierella wolfii]|nr:hypothetical protein BGW41_002398 [Actinomortierella wolfii]
MTSEKPSLSRSLSDTAAKQNQSLDTKIDIVPHSDTVVNGDKESLDTSSLGATKNSQQSNSNGEEQGETEQEILSKVVTTLPLRQLAPAFLGVALAMLMAALDNSIVSTALPKIGTEFKASNKVELVFTCYVITFNAFQGLYGRFSNVLGRKVTFFMAIAIFVLGSILSGVSRSIDMFLACRAVTGIGAGGIFSLSNIVIADLVSIRDRGKFQGFISAVFAISALTGPVLGGAFVDKVTWRWCFYIQAILAAITVPTLAITLKLPAPKGNIWSKLLRIDWLGTFFMAVLTVFILLPTNLGGNLFPWNSAAVITLYALVVPAIVAFLFVEARVAKEPIVPPYLWRNHNVVTLLTLNVFMGMTFWSLMFYLPIYFQIVEGETATSAGLTMIPLEAGIFISSNLCGWLVSRYGQYRPYILGGTSIACIGIGLCQVLISSNSKAVQVVILFFCGLGIGNLFPCLIVAIQASVERKDLATVSALHNYFRMTGSGFGVAICGALFHNQLHSKLVASAIPDDYANLARQSAQRIREIPDMYRGVVELLYLQSMRTVFWALIPMSGMMVLLTLLIRHVRLNAKNASDAPTDPQKDDIEANKAGSPAVEDIEDSILEAKTDAKTMEVVKPTSDLQTLSDPEKKAVLSGQ